MAASLDDVTTYYLLHRHDFGLDDAPIGACILYALSCNLSDSELTDRFESSRAPAGNAIRRPGGQRKTTSEDADDAEDADSWSGGKGNKVKLKAWNQRKGKTLGIEAPGGRPAPLIDQATG